MSPMQAGGVYINGGRLSWDALYVLGHPKYCPPKRRQHWTSLPKRSHLITLKGTKEPDNQIWIVLDPVEPKEGMYLC